MKDELSMIDESVREISALDELYSDIVTSRIKEKQELSLKIEEAKFAREQILKLSLHIRKQLNTLQNEVKK